MATIICIGRDSQAAQHATRLRSQGHKFIVLGSVHEYLQQSKDVAGTVVLISETFDAPARRSIAHWARHGSDARIICLYAHHIEDTTCADALAKANDLENILDAIAFVTSTEVGLAVRA